MKGISATSAREIHVPVASSKTASVYSIVVHASSPMLAIAALTLGSIRTVTDTSAPPRTAAPTVTAPVERRVRTQQQLARAAEPCARS